MKFFLKTEYQVLVLSAILGFSFTLSTALISISFALLCLLGLLFFKIKNISFISCLFFLFYLSSFLSLFYSENQNIAQQKLILKLPILLFPLLVFLFQEISNITKEKIVLILLYCSYFPLFISVYNYFLNKELFDMLVLQSKPIPIEFGYGIYHIQFSVFCCLIILSSFYFLLEKIKTKNFNFMFFVMLVFTILNTVFVHIMSARTGILSLYFGVLIIVIFNLKHVLKNKFILGLLILIPIIIFSVSSSLKNRVKNTIQDFKVVYKGDNANEYSFAMRVLAWKNAINLIKNNPILGVGIGDTEKELLLQFEKNNSILDEKNRKKPHFQLLESYCQSGILNFFLFFLIFLALIFQGIKKRNYILVAMAVSLFISSCFESILERQTSVVLFVFFIAFFINKKSLPTN